MAKPADVDEQDDQQGEDGAENSSDQGAPTAPTNGAAGNGRKGAPPIGDGVPDLGEGAPASERALTKTAKAKAGDRLAEQAEAGRLAKAGLEGIENVGESSLMPFSPTTFQQAWNLAHHLSLSQVTSDGLRGNGGAVLSVMATGAQLGIHWSIAVQIAFVVKGRVTWPAQAIAGLMDSAPGWEYFDVVDADNESATVEGKRTRWSEPRRYTVTIEDARGMGFMDGKHSQLWTSKRPMPMLIAMARREAARLWDPGRMMGIFDPDEIIDLQAIQSANPAPALAGGSTAGLSALAALPAPSEAPDIDAEVLPEAKPAAGPDRTAAAPKPATAPANGGAAGKRAALSDTHIEEIRGHLRVSKVEERELERRLGGSLRSALSEPGETAEEFCMRVKILIGQLPKSPKS